MKLLIKLHRERYRKNDLMITHSYFKTMISSYITFDFLAMEEKWNIVSMTPLQNPTKYFLNNRGQVFTRKK